MAVALLSPRVRAETRQGRRPSPSPAVVIDTGVAPPWMDSFTLPRSWLRCGWGAGGAAVKVGGTVDESNRPVELVYTALVREEMIRVRVGESSSGTS